MTKIVIKVKRIKLIHTNERKNTKKEPIPAPKCPKEKIKYWVLIQDKTYATKPMAESNTLCADKTAQNGI